ncbi:MAG: hypothetical protein H5U04_12475 [Firmicutes bacterium]|nr:hypothetical protein [Bacillota bacterium]
MPRRILAEHSEPGYYIELSDNFEYTLRHLTWQKVQTLSEELLDFCAEVSPAMRSVLAGFHLETPGQAGCLPPCLSTLEPVDEDLVEELTEKINQQKGLRLRLSHTCLLEGKVAGREDYVRDIRDTLSFPDVHIDLPRPILDHRGRLIDGACCDFKGSAQFERSRLGHKWVQSHTEKWRKLLEGVDSELQAVAKYLLDTLRPDAVASEDLPGWCLLSLSVRHDTAERLLGLLEASVEHLYQRFQYCLELVRLTWHIPALLERLERYVEEARSTYTPEAVEAMEALVKELKGPLWP